MYESNYKKSFHNEVVTHNASDILRIHALNFHVIGGRFGVIFQSSFGFNVESKQLNYRRKKKTISQSLS